jgi:hypothetical protein
MQFLRVMAGAVASVVSRSSANLQDLYLHEFSLLRLTGHAANFNGILRCMQWLPRLITLCRMDVAARTSHPTLLPPAIAASSVAVSGRLKKCSSQILATGRL